MPRALRSSYVKAMQNAAERGAGVEISRLDRPAYQDRNLKIENYSSCLTRVGTLQKLRCGTKWMFNSDQHVI